MDADQVQVARLLQRFLEDCAADHQGPSATGRTVGQLRKAAEACATERKRLEDEKRAEEEARREREAAMAREEHLDALVGRETELWAEVDRLIATRQPKSYDQAVDVLEDLRDLDARREKGDFRLRIGVLRQAHARKSSLVQRLRKAGL
jgi:FtsZ-interacting cell division protein YlmF